MLTTSSVSQPPLVTGQISGTAEPIAIIGMAVRAPDTTNPNIFWNKLVKGEDFLKRNVRIEHGRRFVTIDSQVPSWDSFDAGFFNFTERDALLCDPQQRLLLELAWEAFEDAAIDVYNAERNVGVFVTTSLTSYLSDLQKSLPGSSDPILKMAIEHGSASDFAATRLAYKLNFTGPAFTVSTACSSSLVAIDLAVQSLRTGSCQMAIAGGVSLRSSSTYEFIEGSILSPDGICRPFDIAANGTVFGRGGGVVLLKRLKDAIADGDPIYAAITATAVNNDGNRKAGYTAPSREGQAEAINRLLAQIPDGSTGFGLVEAHGTGTRIGDPIEVAALSSGFGYDPERQSCALGSVKSNLGHLDVAAGVIGLIKSALSVYHGIIPPTLNFSAPNPLLDLQNTPFYVNHEMEWWSKSHRRALVCSLGIGGTNAYAAVESVSIPTQDLPKQEEVTSPQALIFSAADDAAANTIQRSLSALLSESSKLSIGDIGHTLRVGRAKLPVRRAIIWDREAQENVRGPMALGTAPGNIVFLFSGQGGQFGPSVKALLDASPSINKTVRKCARYFKIEHSIDVMETLIGEGSGGDEPDTRYIQASLFCLEYSIAQALLDWGIKPTALIGHSIGELVALCTAGGLSLPQAMDLVAERANLMHQSPSGTMLALPLALEVAQKYTRTDISIAAINGPNAVVVSGNSLAIAELSAQLSLEGINAKYLRTSHAFHSSLMTEAGHAFAREALRRNFARLSIPIISTVVGRELDFSDLKSTDYWERSVAGPVRFTEAMLSATASGPTLFLEVGPGPTLTNAVRASAGLGFIREETTAAAVLPSFRSWHPTDLLHLISSAWIFGAEVDWTAVHPDRTVSKVRLPTYPFQRKPFIPERPADDRLVQIGPELVPMSQSTPDSTTRVAQIFERILGRQVMDPTATLFDLGGDSLTCVAALRQISRAFSIEISMPDFLQDPSLKGVVALLEGSARDTVDDKSTNLENLPPDIILCAEADPQRPLVPFITGATGYIGSHLLAGLLERTDALIHCLCRITSDGGRANPIENTLKRYSLWDESYRSRINLVYGDISRPRLGMSETDWQKIAAEATTIFHSAAAVNHVYPAQQLWDVNVGSVVEILRLAGENQAKSVHLLSTMAVFEADAYDGLASIAEDWHLTELPSTELGYSRTKAIAENFLKQAVDRGFSASLYRLPNVVGHRAHGWCNQRDGLWALVKAVATLRALPPKLQSNDPISILAAPVDQIVNAICEISLKPDAVNECIHLFPPGHIDLRQLVQALIEAGYHIDRVNEEEWQNRVHQCRSDPATESFLWVIDNDGKIKIPKRRVYETKKLKKYGSNGLNVTSPLPEDISLYIKKLIESGFLPSPE